ncbi:hypothetical protein NEOC65_001188 [Neochlamydia sp. AcF65]|nr:hypothetical protein [Neochlamydia sp. AcF65]MBS4170186.1 hypothetical protein [Neochlamydia sp. AcF95]
MIDKDSYNGGINFTQAQHFISSYAINPIKNLVNNKLD